MEQDITLLWEEVINQLMSDGTISDMSFRTYITPLEPKFQDENTIYIICPTSWYKSTCQLRFYEPIRNTITNITNKEYDVQFVLKDEIKSEDENKDRELVASTECPEGLNPRYTFDNFITGPNNRFAHEIAKTVVSCPGTQYNPLFIYGGVGLGKTHLMQAIGHEMYAQNPNVKILYTTGEQFANDYISLMVNQNKDSYKTEQFRNKYRNSDILLIDDIQFLVGKDACQEQFFYAFNALFESGKQIVITSEKPPKDIGLEDRLKTRFEMGISVDIQAPDFETRLAILRRKTEVGRYVIPDEILVQVATRVRTNIRELEGVFNKIKAYKTLTKKDLTTSVVNEFIDSVLVKSASVLTSNLIMQVVARFYNIKVEELKSIKRSNNIVFPRQIAMYLCRESANMSYTTIGKEFGGRDHSTVLHACNKVEEEIKSNKETNELVQDIKKALSIEG